MLPCLVALGEEIIDEAAARAWWIRRLHPLGPRCPHCGAGLAGRQAETFATDGRVQCGGCSKFFAARTGTLLNGSHASWRQMMLLVLLSSTGASVFEVAKACRMSVETVVSWQRRFFETGA